MAIPRLCSIEGCGKPASKRGWCGPHYKRWWRNGDPTAGYAMHGEPLAWLQAHIAYSGEGCLIWPFATGSEGRGGVYVDGRIEKPANVMCQMVNGERPYPESQGAHSCGKGNLGCVHPHHLSWKTQAGNEADKIGHGTSNHGERNGQAKLTEADVMAIFRSTGTQRDVATAFGVSASLIGSIRQGKRWGWLTKPTPL